MARLDAARVRFVAPEENVCAACLRVGSARISRRLRSCARSLSLLKLGHAMLDVTSRLAHSFGATRHASFALLSVLVFVATAAITPSPASADGGGQSTRWWRDAKDPRWVQGEVTVDGTPDAVWARLSDVGALPQTLTDLARLKVLEKRKGEDGHTRWKIELETRTLGYGMLGYDVDSGPGREMKLSTNTMGVKAVASTLVRPGPNPGQANVVYSFLVEFSGLSSLLLSSKSLREKQAHMVEVTLNDIGRAFPKPAPTP